MGPGNAAVVRMSAGASGPLHRPSQPVSSALSAVPVIAPYDDAELAARLEEEAALLRIRREARRIVDAETYAGANPGGPAPVMTLTEVLALPPAPPYRIEPLMPSDGSTLVVAQRKAGKTTFLLNLAMALLTGRPLLGAYRVLPLSGAVAVLNFEVDALTFGRWAADHGLSAPELAERFLIVNLRGRANPLADDDAAAVLAAELRRCGVETLIVDPFGQAYTSPDQNSAGEVAAWLRRLSVFAREQVGARDLILSVHAGWSEDGRVRGSSALEDWPDVIVRLKRDETTGVTSLSALGRDVEIAETVTAYDVVSRTVTLGSGSPARAKSLRLAEDVHRWLLEQTEPVTRRAIEERFSSAKNTVGQVLELLTQRNEARSDGTPGKAAWVGIPREGIVNRLVSDKASEASESVRSDAGVKASDRPYRDGRTHHPTRDGSEGLSMPDEPNLGRLRPPDNGSRSYAEMLAAAALPPSHTESDNGDASRSGVAS